MSRVKGRIGDHCWYKQQTMVPGPDGIALVSADRWYRGVLLAWTLEFEDLGDGCVAQSPAAVVEDLTTGRVHVPWAVWISFAEEPPGESEDETLTYTAEGA